MQKLLDKAIDRKDYTKVKIMNKVKDTEDLERETNLII